MLFRCGTNFSVEYFDDKMHCEPHIKLCLLLMFNFLKTISLLLCVLRDSSVLFSEIKIGSNRIESATCR